MVSERILTKIPVIAPVMSIKVDKYFLDSEDDSFCLPNGTDEGMHLINFSESCRVINNCNYKIATVDKFKTPIGEVKLQYINMDSVSQETDLAFAFNYYNQQDDGVTCIFKNQFENFLTEPLLLLRLFVPGDFFIFSSFVDNFDSFKIYRDHAHRNVPPIFIYKNDLNKFPLFYKHYWELLRGCAKNIQNTNAPIKSWAKRINNAAYFFNRTYFVELNDSVVSDGYRQENIDRLISHITALDALFGKSASGKELAMNYFNALKSTFPKAQERITHFYDIRSDYIHANDRKLINKISDKEIAELHLYLQRAILFNLELFGNVAFREKLSQSGLTHYFEYIEKYPESDDIKTANGLLNTGQDLYK